MANNGQSLPPIPNPLKVIDAVGDVVMTIPRVPADVVQRAGAAISGAGAGMEAAVNKATEIADDMPPDPITFVFGAVNYAIAGVKGGVDGVAGAVVGVGDSLSQAASRVQRLGNEK